MRPSEGQSAKCNVSRCETGKIALTEHLRHNRGVPSCSRRTQCTYTSPERARRKGEQTRFELGWISLTCCSNGVNCLKSVKFKPSALSVLRIVRLKGFQPNQMSSEPTSTWQWVRSESPLFDEVGFFFQNLHGQRPVDDTRAKNI